MDTELNIKGITFEKVKGSGATTYLTHNFHTYPAKFIPQIPRATILSLTKEGDTILDPFGGCGTTLVEAKLLNRNAIAVDINPIGILVSKAKTTILIEDQIGKVNKILGLIKEDTKNFYDKKQTKINYVIPTFNNLDHWFDSNVAQELAIAVGYINKISDKDLKNYLLTAFSSIIVEVSNQESDTRFAAIKKELKSFMVIEALISKLEKMNKRILEFSNIASNSKVNIFNGDARNLNFLKDNSIDHVVTSPPYANTYDYYLYHKFRMVWLGYNVKEVQDNEIGSRNRHSSKKEDIDTFEKDLDDCLREINRVLKPNKYAVIVIGDSVIRGKLINAKVLLEKIANKNNFKLVRTISYNLSKNSRMFNPKFTNKDKEEHIMFFKNLKK